MAEFILAVYLTGHLVSFAGTGLLYFMPVGIPGGRKRSWLGFTSALFAQTLLFNGAFVCNTFLGMQGIHHGYDFFLCQMGVLAVLLFTYSRFVRGMAGIRGASRLRFLEGFALIPLAFMVLSVPFANLQGVFQVLGSCLFSLVLLLSGIFHHLRHQSSRHPVTEKMLGIAMKSNLVLALLLPFQAWINFASDLSWIPFSLENLYLLFMHLCQIRTIVRHVRGDEGGKTLPQDVLSAQVPESPYKLPVLAPREEELLSLLSQGLSNKEIGSLMNLSEYTVRNAISRIFRQTGVRNRAQLAGLYQARQNPS